MLAFGDSITNGGGELQWGVALQSWAVWVARGLGVPTAATRSTAPGAVDVIERQIPAFERFSADPGTRYDLGCLYIGVNDVRQPGFEVDVFERSFRRALSFLRERCDRVLSATAPLDLGRPRAGANVRMLNEVIERVAAELGALVLDLRETTRVGRLRGDFTYAYRRMKVAVRALRAAG